MKKALTLCAEFESLAGGMYQVVGVGRFCEDKNADCDADGNRGRYICWYEVDRLNRVTRYNDDGTERWDIPIARLPVKLQIKLENWLAQEGRECCDD